MKRCKAKPCGETAARATDHACRCAASVRAGGRTGQTEPHLAASGTEGRKGFLKNNDLYLLLEASILSADRAHPQLHSGPRQQQSADAVSARKTRKEKFFTTLPAGIRTGIGIWHLILLTDASPDDSRKILPTGKVPLSRSYDGEAGVQDTAEEVRALRQQGVRVAAVFMGENASAPDARTIYGQDLVRIQRMDQLSTAAGKLIQEEIRELSG